MTAYSRSAMLQLQEDTQSRLPKIGVSWTPDVTSSPSESLIDGTAFDPLFHGPMIRQAVQATSIPVSGIRCGCTWYVSYLEYCIPVWNPSLVKDIKLIESVQRWATKMVQGIQHLKYDDRLNYLGLMQLEKKKS